MDRIAASPSMSLAPTVDGVFMHQYSWFAGSLSMGHWPYSNRSARKVIWLKSRDPSSRQARNYQLGCVAQNRETKVAKLVRPYAAELRIVTCGGHPPIATAERSASLFIMHNSEPSTFDLIQWLSAR